MFISALNFADLCSTRDVRFEWEEGQQGSLWKWPSVFLWSLNEFGWVSFLHSAAFYLRLLPPLHTPYTKTSPLLNKTTHQSVGARLKRGCSWVTAAIKEAPHTHTPSLWHTYTFVWKELDSWNSGREILATSVQPGCFGRKLKYYMPPKRAQIGYKKVSANISRVIAENFLF